MFCLLCNAKNNIFTLQKCSHKFCEKCLYYHIKDNFNCKIKCPDSSCSKYLSDPDTRKFLTVSDEERYEKLGLMTIFKKCLSKHCTYVYSIYDLNTNFICPECEQPNCVKCDKRHLPNECRSKCLKSEEELDKEAISILQNKKLNRLQNYDESNDFLPCHIGFECNICCEFILPKQGVMLRCGCYHCKSCLKKVYKEKQHYEELMCSICGTEFAMIEKICIMGLEKLMKMILPSIKQLLHRCQNADCEYIWYTNKTSGEMVCPDCNKVNCLFCEAIHENMTCEQFKQKIFENSVKNLIDNYVNFLWRNKEEDNYKEFHEKAKSMHKLIFSKSNIELINFNFSKLIDILVSILLKYINDDEGKMKENRSYLNYLRLMLSITCDLSNDSNEFKTDFINHSKCPVYTLINYMEKVKDSVTLLSVEAQILETISFIICNISTNNSLSQKLKDTDKNCLTSYLYKKIGNIQIQIQIALSISLTNICDRNSSYAKSAVEFLCNIDVNKVNIEPFTIHDIEDAKKSDL